MKIINLIKYTIISIIYLTLIINHCNSIENRILFKVNNEIITSMDILTELKYLEIINQDFKKTTKKQAFEIAKRSLIREKIKEIELIKLLQKIEVEDKFLNNLLINHFKLVNVKTIEDFEQYFILQDIDPNLIKKKISIEVLWNQLIYSKFKQNVKIDKESNVQIEMTLTSPNCPVAESMPKEVEDKVAEISQVKSAKVNIVFDPPWDKDMMSEEAKLELGFL